MIVCATDVPANTVNNGNVIVTDGKVACVGSATACPVPAGHKQFSIVGACSGAALPAPPPPAKPLLCLVFVHVACSALFCCARTHTGGHVTPGFVETLSHVGLVDIGAESSTQDGRIDSSGATDASAAVSEGAVLECTRIESVA